MDTLYNCEEYYYLCKLMDDSIQSVCNNIYRVFLSGHLKTTPKETSNTNDDDDLYHIQCVNPFIQYGKSYSNHTFDKDVYSLMECGYLNSDKDTTF